MLRAELLAVAPGTVVEAMRDLPDVPAGEAPTNLTIAEIAGNHVTLDLGGGSYAIYAHGSAQRDGARGGSREDRRQTGIAGQQRKHDWAAFAFSDQRPAVDAGYDGVAVCV